jgi:hypothetical protein
MILKSSMAQRSVRSVSHRMGYENLLSRAPPCFARYVKLLALLNLKSLAPTPVLRTVDARQAAGRKNNCQIFIIT